MNHRAAALLWATIGLANASPLRVDAQRGPASAGRGVILGAVADTNLRAIPAANVSVIGTTAQLTTDDGGRFRINDVSPGEYLVWVRRLGYRAVSSLVRVEAGDTLRLAYTLEPTLTELASVVVTERALSPRMRDFTERRKAGFGEFLDQAQIEKLNFIEVAGVLRTFTSVRVEPKPRTYGYNVMSARLGGCPIQVYVDAIPRGNDLDDLPSPKEIAGIEVFAGPATVPFGFATGTGGKPSCGVILIWTRDGS